MVVRAAKIADGLTMAGHSTLANLTHQMELYKAALADEGKPFPPPINRLVLETYVAKDMESARTQAFPCIGSPECCAGMSLCAGLGPRGAADAEDTPKRPLSGASKQGRWRP